MTLIHALSAEGALHSLYASNGRDHVAPVPFLPANTNARGLIVVDGIAYVATANECGGVPDGVWSFDMESGAVASWKSDGGAIAGLGGLSFGPDGTVFASTREGALVALEEKSLNRKAASQPAGFWSSPVVFDFGGTDHVAALARDGSLRVYEAGKLGQPVASSGSQSHAGTVETAIAAWQDADGTRWLLVPSKQSLVAWRMTESDGRLRLDKGWESPSMDAPLPPIVVNGVVFALDGGKTSGTAKLYAFNGTSGSQIWDSGDAIEAPASGHTLSSGPGHVFLTTSASTVYAFGFPMEH